jgi:NAD(P)-dependent dehydrogenase (short-subunit alcohol dehydrogenase family)
MAKAAVNQLARSAAAEVAARPNVAVTAILPGRVDTPMQRRLVAVARDADPSFGLADFQSMEGVSRATDVARAVGDLLAREPSELNGHIFRYASSGWTAVE